MENPKQLQEDFQKDFTYNPETGELFKLVKGKLVNGLRLDRIDANKQKRYRVMTKHKKYPVFTFIHIYMYGTFPKRPIKPIDNNYENLKLKNLDTRTNVFYTTSPDDIFIQVEYSIDLKRYLLRLVSHNTNKILESTPTLEKALVSYKYYSVLYLTRSTQK